MNSMIKMKYQRPYGKVMEALVPEGREFQTVRELLDMDDHIQLLLFTEDIEEAQLN